MTTVKEFHRWYEERKVAFELENQIMLEKLSIGIDGIEWLVLQVVVNELKQESLDQWIRFLKMFNHTDTDAVMKDALTMKERRFYRKYKFNWWISVDETLTYLSLLKQRDYDHYFKFIQSLK